MDTAKVAQALLKLDYRQGLTFDEAINLKEWYQQEISNLRIELDKEREKRIELLRHAPLRR